VATSLRARVAGAILLVALAPQLLVFAWSQIDRGVPQHVGSLVRDAADAAASTVERGRTDDEALRAIARARRVRLRVLDGAERVELEEDADRPGGTLERVEAFFLGGSPGRGLAELDAERGPLGERIEVREARRAGEWVACEYAPLLVCRAARRVGSRVVIVEASSQRAVAAVYELRGKLSHLALLTVPLALALAVWTAGRVVRPIVSLRRQALDRAARARGATALEPESRDEVADLAEAFNGLLRTLEGKQADHERFVADLVHELKTPVAAVRAAAESLAGGAADEERAARLARVLEDSTRKLDALVTQFLELARAEAGMPDEERVRVDMTILVRGLAAAVGDDGRHGRLTLACACEHGAPLDVLGVPHRLDALVRELLENAASFTGDGGRVDVSVRADAGHVVVTVTDDGPGIAEADLPRVFDRFFTTRGAARGTGLGLALVAAVARAHGGQVTARAESGRGATFEVRLPRAA